MPEKGLSLVRHYNAILSNPGILFSQDRISRPQPPELEVPAASIERVIGERAVMQAREDRLNKFQPEDN